MSASVCGCSESDKVNNGKMGSIQSFAHFSPGGERLVFSARCCRSRDFEYVVDNGRKRTLNVGQVET